jgi:hypothetical protein
MRVATPMPSLRRRGETVSGRLLRSSRSPSRTSSLSASSSSMVRDPASAWTPSTSFYLTPGKAVMALFDSNTRHVQGHFEETKLPRIHLGDAANVQLMGSHHTLRGRVESIAAGIEDRDRSAGAPKDSHGQATPRHAGCRACSDSHFRTSELLDQTNFGLEKCW